KETKFSIAKKYNTTIEDLEKRNPEIVSSLPVGYRVTIKGTAPKTEAAATGTNVSKSEETKKSAESRKEVRYVDYHVKPKETFYSVGRVFHVSQEEVAASNQSLSEGVKEAMVLKVPAG